MIDWREYDDSTDRSAVADLISSVARHDGAEPLAEEKKAEWLVGDAGAQGEVGIISDRIVCYVHATWNPATEAWSVETAVHPAHRSVELVEAMLAHTARVLDGRRPGPIHLWAFAPWLERWAEAEQYPLLRQLLIMGRPLPATPPEPMPGIRLAAFAPGTDDAVFLVVNNRAFGDHPENGSWDGATLAERMSRPWFDASGFLLAWAGDQLAGFCWTKRHDPATGEIYVIATDPDHRGKGLGRFLLRAGLDHLTGSGCTQAILYVRAGEEAAEQLYRSEGFRPLERRSEFLYSEG